MITILLGAAVVSALLAIAADWNERKHPAFYLLKPLTTLLIIGLALAAVSQPLPPYAALVLAGLALSLAGDVALMFRGNAWFAAGLGSFLVAHGFFIAAFVSGPATLPVWSAVVALPVLALAAVLIPRAGPLKPAVAVYVLALSAMAAAAIARHEAMPDTRTLAAMAGSLVFLVSDGALGIRQFVGPYRGAQALILSTYWLGIGLIALSV